MPGSLLRRVTTFAALLAVLSCGEDSTAPEDEDFLPVFTRTWRSTRDPNHSFALVSQNDRQASGTVTGEESLNFKTSRVEGTFQNSRITSLIIHRATGDRTYTGRFLHPEILLLISASDSILLYRPQ